jgi:uncharacterized BrkB/YihY/UPF0761 family membrane protein
MKNKFKQIYHNFLKILKKPEMQILPGQLAFFFLMSFIPILAICTMIVASFTNNINFLNAFHTEVLPDAIYEIIFPFWIMDKLR